MSEPSSVVPEEEQKAPESSQAEQQSSKLFIPLWLALIAMVIALIGAALILSRVGRPLYALLFPQEVPVPAGVHETEHVKPKKGDEYWIYRTSMSGEEVAHFYEKHGSTCQYDPKPEALNPQASHMEPVPYSVAQCSGTKHSGGLGVSWQVYIHSGYSDEEGPTVFRLYKLH